MSNNTCSACHGDQLKDLSGAKILLNLIGIESEHPDPGGRTLVIKGMGQLHLSDYCNSCDEMEIAKFIAEHTVYSVQSVLAQAKTLADLAIKLRQPMKGIEKP